MADEDMGGRPWAGPQSSGNSTSLDEQLAREERDAKRNEYYRGLDPFRAQPDFASFLLGATDVQVDLASVALAEQPRFWVPDPLPRYRQGIATATREIYLQKQRNLQETAEATAAGGPMIVDDTVTSRLPDPGVKLGENYEPMSETAELNRINTVAPTNAQVKALLAAATKPGAMPVSVLPSVARPLGVSIEPKNIPPPEEKKPDPLSVELNTPDLDRAGPTTQTSGGVTGAANAVMNSLEDQSMEAAVSENMAVRAPSPPPGDLKEGSAGVDGNQALDQGTNPSDFAVVPAAKDGELPSAAEGKLENVQEALEKKIDRASAGANLSETILAQEPSLVAPGPGAGAPPLASAPVNNLAITRTAVSILQPGVAAMPAPGNVNAGQAVAGASLQGAAPAPASAAPPPPPPPPAGAAQAAQGAKRKDGPAAAESEAAPKRRKKLAHEKTTDEGLHDKLKGRISRIQKESDAKNEKEALSMILEGKNPGQRIAEGTDLWKYAKAALETMEDTGLSTLPRKNTRQYFQMLDRIKALK